MSDLSGWLHNQEKRFSPYFPVLGHPGAKEHVVGLLLLHAATCGEHFRTGPDFLEGILGMYRINGGSPFTLPVDGWAKIRRAEQIGMADELSVDLCDTAYLRAPLQPISEELVVESLRELVRAAPVVDSRDASQALAEWRETHAKNVSEIPLPDVNTLADLRVTVDADDQGITAVLSFWTIQEAYSRLALEVHQSIRQRSGEQLLLLDDPHQGISVPVDLPERILSTHLRVLERSPEGTYFAKARLYLACLEWYRRKKMHPKPMGYVASAVALTEISQSVAEAR